MRWEHARWIPIDDGTQGCLKAGTLGNRPVESAAKFSRLMRHVALELAKENVKFFKQTNKEDIFFEYGERQMDSALLPAFRDAGTTIVLVQHPVRRGLKKKAKSGWLDYWVDYKRDAFAFEVKFASISALSPFLRKAPCQKWDDAVDALARIEDREEIGLLGWRSETLHKVCLMVLPLKRRESAAREMKRKAWGQEELKKVLKLDKFLIHLKGRPCWAAIWLTPEWIQTRPFSDEWKGDASNVTHWNYPAMLLLARVVETWKKDTKGNWHLPIHLHPNPLPSSRSRQSSRIVKAPRRKERAIYRCQQMKGTRPWCIDSK